MEAAPATLTNEMAILIWLELTPWSVPGGETHPPVPPCGPTLVPAAGAVVGPPEALGPPDPLLAPALATPEPPVALREFPVPPLTPAAGTPPPGFPWALAPVPPEPLNPAAALRLVDWFPLGTNSQARTVTTSAAPMAAATR